MSTSTPPGSLQSALQTARQRLEQLKPDRFELYLEHNRGTKIESRDQEIETFSRSEDVGLSVRVTKDRRLGFSFTTSLEDGAVRRAVESAFEIAGVMPEDEFAVLPGFAPPASYPKFDAFDSAGLAADVKTKIQMAKELESLTRAADPRITGVRSSSIYEGRSEIHLLNSDGHPLSFQSTHFTAYVTAKAEENGDSQMGGEFGFSHKLAGLDIHNVGLLAARWATELLGSKAASTMRCPAVFRNSVMAELVEFLADSFSAEQIDKGRSMLAGHMGEKLFSDRFTLVDDGLLPGGYASSPFDGEGTASSKTILVDAGKVSGTLFDAYYARKFGKKPTGHAARGIKAPPSIAHSNLYITPGKVLADSLLDGISQGILITDLMGVHTANAVTGDFSLGASGILIENGKLTRPVRGFAVAGNVLEVFRRIVDTGNDLKFFGSIGAPSARISEISVGGT